MTQVDNKTWIIGNDVWNMTQNYKYGTKLFYGGRDCVGNAVGHYVSYNGAASDLAWNSASIVDRGKYKGVSYIDVAFYANEGDMHWVIFQGLHGAYQYFVNHALPTLGEFRTLWRLDNTTFTHGKTDIKDEELPPLSWYLPENKVQDETWLMPDGSGRYITKYDWTSWTRDQKWYGVYGKGFGSWYINAGKDYYGGNQLKQELMVHRESATGDAVQLNMIHGTHFQAASSDAFPDGKMWGPWLWYLNDGSFTDVSNRAKFEFTSWPYSWFPDSAYQSRGSVTGQIKLSDGRPAGDAAVFLGDNYPKKTALDMGTDYYYTGYTDSRGYFSFENVRAGSYGLQAWSNGGTLADVSTSFLKNDVTVSKGKTSNLRTLMWEVSNKKKLFQVGDFDRTAYGFKYGGAPYQHALMTSCPADIEFVVGESAAEEWCFVQGFLGNWTIKFDVNSVPASGTNATLIVSLAGYSSGSSSTIWVNDIQIGNLTSGAEGLANDQSVYRSCTAAGEWRYFEFGFDAESVLVKGTNEVRFELTRQSTWHGFMWDSIILEA